MRTAGERHRRNRLVGWRFWAFAGSLAGAIGLALYPIAIAPMIDSSYWKNIQNETRAGVDKEKIQPGGMKVWQDPFDRPSKSKKNDSSENTK